MEENEIRERMRNLPDLCKKIGISLDENCEIDVNEGTIRIFGKRQGDADRIIMRGWTIIYQKGHYNNQEDNNLRCRDKGCNNQRELERRYFAF